MSETDTIVAVATGTAAAPVAIIRLSGTDARAILGELFRPFGGIATDEFPSHRLVFGRVIDTSGQVIDHAFALVMRAPHTLTGEDVVEFQCHGGLAVVSAIVDACVRAGARPAGPGEFTKRGFLNGRLDLARAEAICDLIVARTELSRRLALRQMSGGLSHAVGTMRARLIETAALIEAHIDFPDEEIPPLSQHQIEESLEATVESIRRMLSGFDRGRLVREGARVVLAGKANSGKSSVFNAVIGRERAIVTPHPGTTRDTIECTIDLGGVPVTLVDTAGLRDAIDAAEQFGIERSVREIESADVILWIVDATDHSGPDSIPPRDDALPGPRRMVVLNKIDLLQPSQVSAALRKCSTATQGATCLALSALTRDGVATLEQTLRETLIGSGIEEELLISSARHAECLRHAAESLERALGELRAGQSGEFVMVDLRDAILRLGEILGLQLSEEILDQVFSRFCVGK